jgi:hypothetical protein
VDTQCRNVWEPAAGEVDVLAVVFLGLRTHVCAQVMLDSGFLVPGSLEVIAEAARRAGPSNLGREADSATDRSDVRACCREDWVELGCLPILVQTRSTDTGVSGGLEDRHAAHTEDSNHIADTDRVLLRDCLLVVSVRVCDDLRQLVVWLSEQELVVGQVWLVLVRFSKGLDWIRDVRPARVSVGSFCIKYCFLDTYGLPAVMYSVIGRGCEMATMFCTSKLASPSSALDGGCGSAVAPSSGLTRTTEKLENHVRGRYTMDI